MVIIFSYFFGFTFGAYDLKNEGPLFYLLPNLKFIKSSKFTFLNNYINSDDDVETIYLDVKFKNWKKLTDQRNSVYNYANIFKTRAFIWDDSIDKVEVNGKITLKDEVKKVKLGSLNP